MFIRIGGVPGVGKTTVINEIVETSSRLGLPVEKVKGADYLLNILGITSYEDLRKLPEEVRCAARSEMFRRMYEDDRADPQTIRLRDAHFTLVDPKNGETVIFPLMPEDKEQILSMVVLTANPETILSRRIADKDRQDRMICLGSIIREQNTEIKVAQSQSQELGIKLVAIDNTLGSLFFYKEFISRAFPEGNIASALEMAFFGSVGTKENRF